MSKTQPALRIMGDRVRYFRKLRGLSQAELAKGICTQATISLIEKRNKVPSMNILIRLTNRLNITLADIMVENQDRTQQALSLVEQKVRHGDYADAAPIIAKINVKKLADKEDQKRYYYYRGMVELFVNHAQDEAIYYFGRVLNPLTHTYRDLPAIMATLGLGIAYAEKGTSERARVYMEQAHQLLKETPLTESRYLDMKLTIYWHIARIYFELQEYDAVLKYLQQGIDLAVKNDSLFLLNEDYALLARTLKQLRDPRADGAFQVAVALAEVTSSQELLAQLKAEVASA